jgi:hypothetical protein
MRIHFDTEPYFFWHWVPSKIWTFKFCRTTVIVEYQEPTLMQIMILGKSRPPFLGRYIAFAIIVHLKFIWRPPARSFSKNSLADLTTIHKFSKLQRKVLTFVALGVRKSKETKGVPGRSLW